jgi:aldose 1-epimerase
VEGTRRAVAPSGEQLEIAFGDQQAVVVEVGGGLRSYSVGGRDALDGYPAEGMATSGRGQVLIPWPNRLQDGAYAFDARDHRLALTEPERGNAIHGLVRWAAWTPTAREADRVVVEHVLRPQPGYPFCLELRIEYALAEEGLSVRTTATNVGNATLPFGAGAHPYLTVGTPTVDRVVMQAPGRSVVHSDERGIPTHSAPVEGTEYDFRKSRPVAATALDHTFTDVERGADGLARVVLRHPDDESGLTLWFDGSYPYVQLFTGDPLPDVNRRSLAVEPMTCPANAFRSGEGLLRLEPGASFTGSWGISPLSGS